MWERIIDEIITRHRGKALGVLLGLVASILFVSFGFWKTILIVICIGAGYLLGKNIDEDKDMELWLRKIFKDK
jgi:uncharacterized membrane protein